LRADLVATYWPRPEAPEAVRLPISTIRPRWEDLVPACRQAASPRLRLPATCPYGSKVQAAKFADSHEACRMNEGARWQHRFRSLPP
jgi:hypothetical protein